jgi:hypothetical protein
MVLLCLVSNTQFYVFVVVVVVVSFVVVEFF